MLRCQGCMRHCLQTLIGDSASISAKPRIAVVSYNTKPFTRNISNQSEKFSPSKTKELEPWQIKMGKPLERKASKQWGGHQRTPKKKEVTEREISIHLKYLKDPIQLAEFVRKALRDDNIDLAQKVVNAASASTPCVVSWNHIIEWQLSKGKMLAALKSYNDVSAEG